jgi:hypothetical protein
MPQRELVRPTNMAQQARAMRRRWRRRVGTGVAESG